MVVDDDESRKRRAAEFLKAVRFETLTHVVDSAGSIDAWNAALQRIASTVAEQLRPKFSGSNMDRIDSASRAAVQTIAKRLAPDLPEASRPWTRNARMPR